jgi:hypothetical protein
MGRTTTDRIERMFATLQRFLRKFLASSRLATAAMFVVTPGSRQTLIPAALKSKRALAAMT